MTKSEQKVATVSRIHINNEILIKRYDYNTNVVNPEKENSNNISSRKE